MNISNYPILITNKYYRQNNFSTNPTGKGLKTDAFELGKKSSKNVSFGSIYVDAVNEESFRNIISLFEDGQDVSRIIGNNWAKKIKDMPYIGDKDITRLLAESGIKTFAQLRDFLKIYYKKNSHQRKVFDKNHLEAIKIFGNLSNKSNFSRYPEILLEICLEEDEKDFRDYTRLDKVSDFLPKVGVYSHLDFDENFSHLKPQFNDFLTYADRVEAIEHSMSIYPETMEFVSQNFPQSSKKSVTPEVLYSQNNQVIDYLFNDYKNDVPRNYSGLIDLLIDSSKISKNAVNELSNDFSGLTDLEDKVNFYEFLLEAGVGPADVNKLISKSFVENSDYLSILLNKGTVVSHLDQSGIYQNAPKNQTPEIFYFKFRDVINAVYSESEKSFDLVDTLAEFILKHPEINEQKDFLKFYNKMNGVNARSLTAQEISGFVDLLRFDFENTNILKMASQKKCLGIDVLKAEKSKFEGFEKDIQLVMGSDETGYFAGKTPFEVYKENRKLILENPLEIEKNLLSISSIGISSSDTSFVSNIMNKGQFSSYSEMLEFLSRNKIKTNASTSDEKYKQNVARVFDLLADNSDENLVQQRLDYIKNSDFLLKSRDDFNELFSLFTDEQELKEIMGKIADTQVPSIHDFIRFLKKYKNGKGSYVNAIANFKSIPNGVSFIKNRQLIKKLSNGLLNLNLPVNINGNNIHRVNSWEYFGEKDFNQSLFDLETKLIGTGKSSSFILELPKSFINSNSSGFINKKLIADEITARYFDYGRSYKNMKNYFDFIDTDEARNLLKTQIVENVQRRIPTKFLAFINSSDWYNIYDDKTKVPNLSLHSKLRFIDRYLLEKFGDNYSSPEAIAYSKEVFKTIYTTPPHSIEKGEDDLMKMIYFTPDNREIKAIFGFDGTLVTISPTK